MTLAQAAKYKTVFAPIPDLRVNNREVFKGEPVRAAGGLHAVPYHRRAMLQSSSEHKLKLLETVKLFLDLSLMARGRALSNPRPLLDFQNPLVAVRL